MINKPIPQWLLDKLNWYHELRQRNMEYYDLVNKNSYTNNEMLPFYILFGLAWVCLGLGVVFNIAEMLIVWFTLLLFSLMIDPDDWNRLRGKPSRRKQK